MHVWSQLQVSHAADVPSDVLAASPVAQAAQTPPGSARFTKVFAPREIAPPVFPILANTSRLASSQKSAATSQQQPASPQPASSSEPATSQQPASSSQPSRRVFWLWNRCSSRGVREMLWANNPSDTHTDRCEGYGTKFWPCKPCSPGILKSEEACAWYSVKVHKFLCNVTPCHYAGPPTHEPCALRLLNPPTSTETNRHKFELTEISQRNQK